jgi:DNA invertase Pin-like site-specific DNA recombinase
VIELTAANVRDCGKDADMDKQKITILYERLSAEDEKDMESNSIKTQRAMLEDYAEKNGFIPYIHATDDGWSGTRWDRPGWQEVMNRVEAGEVANLLVKDSSRIGRDFLRVGLIRERFQELNVRLIAINDNIDSARGGMTTLHRSEILWRNGTRGILRER